jgi:hypothetical protein
MKFENPKSDGGSYEKPKEGKYIGLLIGFCYVGRQDGGQYGSKEKVLLRWELHKRNAPSRDSKAHIHTVTSMFGATIRGDQSLLKKALEAHGINLPEGTETNSRDWLGRGAWLDLKLSDDQKYINVVDISRLDPDDDTLPTKQLHFEHWEGEQDGTPPSWAHWAIGRSQDLSHLAPEKSKANSKPQPAPVRAAKSNDDDTDFDRDRPF